MLLFRIAKYSQYQKFGRINPIYYDTVLLYMNCHSYSLNKISLFNLTDLYVQYVTAKLQLSQNRRISHFVKKLAFFLN
jgi:hypothetical protein